jgi:hypothetical protein
MKRIPSFCLPLVFIFCLSTYCQGETSNIEGLVEDFQKATGLQREQILNDNLGKEISTSAIATNVEEYNFFDTASGIKNTYYQVSTEKQKTKNNTTYQLIFLFKDKEKVKDIDKSQLIHKDGKIIRIIDERLQITIWVLCGDLAEGDKALFKGN